MKKELLFLGDLFYDYDFPAEDLNRIAGWISENQYRTVLNMEGGLWGKPSAEISKRGAHLHAHVQTLDMLRSMNTAGVCLANNHTMDYGAEGLEKTLALLDEAGIAHTGAGRDLFQATEPLTLDVDGKTITVLNFGWEQEETVPAGKGKAGCSPRDMELILETLRKQQIEKKEGDKTVVCIHWGFEYNRLPQPYDMELGHAMIDAGADLVIGHHPHCMQPKEIYKGKSIYYSLGDFYFSSRRVRHNRQFPEAVPGQCDFGLGVIWDPETDDLKEVLFHFDRTDKNSKLIAGPNILDSDEKAMKAALEDISGVDYTSAAYRKTAEGRKKNINPVLGLDEKENRKKLQQMANRKKLRRILKKILRR